MTGNYDITPTSPEISSTQLPWTGLGGTCEPESDMDNKSLPELFGDVFDLARQLSSRMKPSDIDDKLDEILRRSGRRAGAAGGSRTVPFDAAASAGACEAVFCGQSLSESLEARLRAVEQRIASTRHELAAVRVEARQIHELIGAAYSETQKARTGAMEAYADAARVMSEARAYHDAALEQAASIVRDARAAATDSVRHELAAAALEARQVIGAAHAEAERTYADAARVMSEARAYHDAALEQAASIVRDARAAAADIVHAARDVQRVADRDVEIFALPWTVAISGLGDTAPPQTRQVFLDTSAASSEPDGAWTTWTLRPTVPSAWSADVFNPEVRGGLALNQYGRKEPLLRKLRGAFLRTPVRTDVQANGIVYICSAADDSAGPGQPGKHRQQEGSEAIRDSRNGLCVVIDVTEEPADQGPGLPDIPQQQGEYMSADYKPAELVPASRSTAVPAVPGPRDGGDLTGSR